jgi:DNA gyrase subunit A
VGDDDDVIYITTGGQVVRTPASDISRIGRGTQGVRLITLQSGDAVASAARATPDETGPEGETAEGLASPVAGSEDGAPAGDDSDADADADAGSDADGAGPAGGDPDELP